ncbi:MAG TPA: gamma-glutamylcyclotransferase family protein [Candidatus Binatia bacterium]
MYYFAYGSNMNWEQMQRRCPSAEFVCVACLADYSFAIARHSRLRNCGTANIFPDAGSRVWGVVYYVAEQDLLILDGFEDGYVREKIFVAGHAAGHSEIESLVYIATKEEDVPLPNPEYKRLMLDGARHWQLPPDYISMLDRIEVANEAAPISPSSLIPVSPR